MNEKEFLDVLESSLNRIEEAVESCDRDIDVMRSGLVVTLEFADASKIVINGQPAMAELWVAAKAGGFHYRHDGQVWRNTRDQSELFATLTRLVSEQAGVPVQLIA